MHIHFIVFSASRKLQINILHWNNYDMPNIMILTIYFDQEGFIHNMICNPDSFFLNINWVDFWYTIFKKMVKWCVVLLKIGIYKQLAMMNILFSKFIAPYWIKNLNIFVISIDFLQKSAALNETIIRMCFCNQSHIRSEHWLKRLWFELLNYRLY